MTKIEQTNGRYTINEQGRFHSFNGEPAIFINDHFATTTEGVEAPITGYKAWYEDGKRLKTEYNSGEIVDGDR